MDGFRQGLITAGLNHVAHLAITKFDNITFSSLDEIKEKYPRFYKVLTKLQDFVASNPEVAKAFMENSGLSSSKMLALLNIDSLQNLPIEVDEIVSVFRSGNGKDYYDKWNVGGKTILSSKFRPQVKRI